jgi:hypothetical protein
MLHPCDAQDARLAQKHAQKARHTPVHRHRPRLSVLRQFKRTTKKLKNDLVKGCAERSASSSTRPPSEQLYFTSDVPYEKTVKTNKGDMPPFFSTT